MLLVGSAIALLGVDDNQRVPMNEAVSDRVAAAVSLLAPRDLMEIERDGISGDSYEVEFLQEDGKELEVQLDGNFDLEMVPASGNWPTEAHVTRAKVAARDLSLHDGVKSVERSEGDGMYEVELNMAGSELEVLLDSKLNVVTATRE